MKMIKKRNDPAEEVEENEAAYTGCLKKYNA